MAGTLSYSVEDVYNRAKRNAIMVHDRNVLPGHRLKKKPETGEYVLEEHEDGFSVRVMRDNQAHFVTVAQVVDMHGVDCLEVMIPKEVLDPALCLPHATDPDAVIWYLEGLDKRAVMASDSMRDEHLTIFVRGNKLNFQMEELLHLVLTVSTRRIDMPPSYAMRDVFRRVRDQAREEHDDDFQVMGDNGFNIHMEDGRVELTIVGTPTGENINVRIPQSALNEGALIPLIDLDTDVPNPVLNFFWDVWDRAGRIKTQVRVSGDATQIWMTFYGRAGMNAARETLLVDIIHSSAGRPQTPDSDA